MPTQKIKGGGYHNTEEVGLSQDVSALLINGYVDDLDNTIKVPGKKQFVQIGTDATTNVSVGIKGLFFWRNFNVLIAVGNDKNIYWVDMVDTTNRGIVTGAGVSLTGFYPPTFADGKWASGPAIFIADGGRMINLTVTRSGTAPYLITNVTMAYVLDTVNAPGAVSHVAFLDGYILCNNIGTDEIHITVDSLDATSATAWTDTVGGPVQHYFRCDYRPDNIIAFTIYNREIVCFSGTSVETWVIDASMTYIPFSRINAACFDIGIAYQAAFCVVDNILYWMDNQQQVRAFDGRNILVISRTMNKYLTDISTKEAVLCIGLVEGRSCLFIILPFAASNSQGVTLCYDTFKKDWALWGEAFYNYTSLEQNPLYGGTTNFNGFCMARDKINCSVQIVPLISGDTSYKSNIGVSLSDNGGTNANWFSYNTDELILLSSVGAPVPTEQSVLAYVNNRIYKIGGHTHVNSGPPANTEYRKFVLSYYPFTQTWETQTISDAPVEFAYSSYCVHNSDIYIMGGRQLVSLGVYATINGLAKLNIDTGIWTVYIPNVPAIYSHSGNLIYVENYNNTGVDFLLYVGVDSNSNTNIWYAYVSDPSQWFHVTTVPTARYAMGVVLVGNYLYCIGGATNIDSNGYWSYLPTILPNTCSNVEIFNIITGTWSTTVNQMPYARSAFGCSFMNGKIYILGGWDSTANASSLIQIFDPYTNTWSTSVTPLNIAVAGFSGGLLPNGTKTGFGGTYEGLGMFLVDGVQKQIPPYNIQTKMQRYRV